MAETVIAAAQRIAEARLARRALPELDPAIRPSDEAQAYRVQDALHDILTRAGLGALAGHKIGCTTKVMQEFLRIPNPCAGGVFATTVFSSPASIRHADFL